jgi:hypothetical protein
MPELPVDATDEQRALQAEAYKPYRELAHKIGLRPEQAKALSEFELDRLKAYQAKGEEELSELKGKLGRDYESKLAAGQKAFAQIFGGDEEAAQLAQELDRKVGSARLVKASMRLAEIMGEHHLIETDTIEGFGDVKDADAKIDELQADEEWRKRYNAGDAKTVGEYKRLLELAKKQAARRQGAGATV